MIGRIVLALAVLTTARAGAEGAGDTMNVRFNPVGLLAGAVTLNYDVKIAEQWTLGPELTYWDINLTSNDGNSYDIYALGGGMRATWFANGIFVDGVYVGPSLAVARKHLKATNSDGSATLDRTALVATGIVG